MRKEAGHILLLLGSFPLQAGLLDLQAMGGGGGSHTLKEISSDPDYHVAVKFKFDQTPAGH